MKTGGDTIEVIDEFLFLGICIIKHRDELKDKRRVGQANNSYHSLLPVVKSREVHKQTKIKLYKTLITSISWNLNEAWTLLQPTEKILNAFERKVIKKICIPLLVNEQWQNRHNHEIYNLYKDMEISRNVRLRGLQWVGHVIRVKVERVPKIALEGYIERRRPIGRPRGRWLNAMDRDARGCWNAGVGDGWQRIEMFGGRGLRRPRPKLGSSASGEEELLANADRTSWPSTGWNTNSWNVSCSTELEKKRKKGVAVRRCRIYSTHKKKAMLCIELRHGTLQNFCCGKYHRKENC